jgi:hypothetical protein
LNQPLPLSTCHCQPVPITCNKLYQLALHQPVPQPVPSTSASTMHQTYTNNLPQQPVQTTYHNNMSHQSYQPNHIYQDKYATSSINDVSTILLTSASNHVPSMYQSCINCTSTMTHQDVPTSSTIHLMYVPTHQLLISTMYLNHIPHTYTNITIKIYVTIHHSIHKPNTINPYIKPCDTTSLLCSLKKNQKLQQHITTKIPIPICQIPTTKDQLYPSKNLIYAAILNIKYHIKS